MNRLMGMSSASRNRRSGEGDVVSKARNTRGGLQYMLKRHQRRGAEAPQPVGLHRGRGCNVGCGELADFFSVVGVNALGAIGWEPDWP
jgi:hypothetical protein